MRIDSKHIYLFPVTDMASFQECFRKSKGRLLLYTIYTL